MKFNNKNIFISPKAKIGENVKIGDNTYIYDNVVIGDNSVISDNCVIGEPTTDYYQNIDKYENPVTIIKDNALIRSYSILYAGSIFGKNFSTGHRVTIRENSSFGDYCRVGTVSDIQGNCTFGNHCWLHSNVHICQGSKIGNYIFIYPYVVLTNDPTPPSNNCLAPTIGDYSQIAVSSIILPNITIGQHALIGAGSVVGNDVKDYQLVVGNPAKFVKDVRDIKNKTTGESHYPWPKKFNRGMPWEGTNYEEWIKL